MVWVASGPRTSFPLSGWGAPIPFRGGKYQIGLSEIATQVGTLMLRYLAQVSTSFIHGESMMWGMNCRGKLEIAAFISQHNPFQFYIGYFHFSAKLKHFQRSTTIGLQNAKTELKHSNTHTKTMLLYLGPAFWGDIGSQNNNYASVWGDIWSAHLLLNLGIHIMLLLVGQIFVVLLKLKLQHSCNRYCMSSWSLWG